MVGQAMAVAQPVGPGGVVTVVGTPVQGQPVAGQPVAMANPMDPQKVPQGTVVQVQATAVPVQATAVPVQNPQGEDNPDMTGTPQTGTVVQAQAVPVQAQVVSGKTA